MQWGLEGFIVVAFEGLSKFICDMGRLGQILTPEPACRCCSRDYTSSTMDSGGRLGWIFKAAAFWRRVIPSS